MCVWVGPWERGSIPNFSIPLVIELVMVALACGDLIAMMVAGGGGYSGCKL